MTTEQIRSHEQEMAVQRERFQRFWEQIVEPNLLWMNERQKMETMHRAWQMWREKE